jgi:hypothetical protein
MQIQPIDLTSVIAVIMGISIVLIPVIGLTARFALKPTVEALSRIFEGRSMDESVQILERRVALLEQQVETYESALKRLEESTAFDRQLRSGGADDANA